MVSIKDIAHEAGVSVSTVSNAINGKKNVGEETRKRILDLCEQMGYVTNASGKNMKNADSNIILFNFSDFDRDFFLKVINGISNYASNNGFDLMICTKKSCEKFIRSGITSGCITLDMAIKDDFLREMASPEYPIVTLDRYIDSPYIKSVLINNYDSMSLLMRGLVERGYKRFAFIGGAEKTRDNKERYAAFIDVLEENHLSFTRKSYYSGDYREKSGYMAAKIMILSNELPDCIVCANDNMAIGAIKACREAGISVPECVAVTGFDNCINAESMGLTTVEVPDYERGYLAAQYLIENIRGNSEMEPLKINAKVIWRKTTISASDVKKKMRYLQK